MKLGFIAEAFNEKLTGIGNTQLNLINSLNSIIGSENLYLINYQETTCVKNETILIKNPNILLKKHLWYLSLPRKTKNINLDIIHNPTQLCTFFKFFSKNVLTIHDITPLLFPDKHPFGISIYNRLFMPNTLKHADEIIAVSNNTKKDLIDFFNIQPEKVHVIYWGIDEKFSRIAHDENNEIRKKYGIYFPYILYLGTLEPRKNLITLIKSFYRVKKKGILQKLVIAGGKGWKYSNIFNLIDKLHLNNEVFFLDYISQDDLPGLYSGADIFVYPSLYEGFGLPPLEAMACGCPVITSNTSSLPEVVGDAGIMVDPLDSKEMAEKIEELISNLDLQEELRKRGIERSKEFSWKKCAKQTYDLYNSIL